MQSQYGTGKRLKSCFSFKKIAFCVDDDQRLSYERSRGYCTSWWEGAAQVFLLRARQWKEFKSSVVSELEKSCCLPEELVKPSNNTEPECYWGRTKILSLLHIGSPLLTKEMSETREREREHLLICTLSTSPEQHNFFSLCSSWEFCLSIDY